MPPIQIAIAVFEGAEELDFVGPWEVLAAWHFVHPEDVEVFLVGDGDEPITCAKGLRVLADRTWDAMGPVDVLVYPGGRGTRAQLGDDRIRTRLRDLQAQGTLMTSVCTGALVYADAGCSTGSRRRRTGARSTSYYLWDAESSPDRMTGSWMSGT